MKQNKKTKEKDSTIKRMKKGFKVLTAKIKGVHKKIYDSQLVKNIQSQNDKTEPESLMPKEFQEKKKKKGEKGFFDVDFKDIDKCDL